MQREIYSLMAAGETKLQVVTTTAVVQTHDSEAQQIIIETHDETSDGDSGVAFRGEY
jgi:hypothetical protein